MPIANQDFEFEMLHPAGPLSSYVQAIWSAAVPENAGTVKRWLKSDAANGIIFVLGQAIELGEIRYEANGYWFPVSRQAEVITLAAGTRVAGIRFHPAAGFGVGKHCLNHVKPGEDFPPGFDYKEIESALKRCTDHGERIDCLQAWLQARMPQFKRIPSSLLRARKLLHHNISMEQVSQLLPLSQRQLERQFKAWTGITAKEYQRIIRVKNVWDAIKRNPSGTLVEIALANGFSDQAHMTREFKHIAGITPSKFSRLNFLRQHANAT